MAKLKMPLMSQSASGKLGDSLVFFNWKGLDVVRSYVIPANPKTASQTTQRGYFTSAVQLFHNTSFTDADRSAMNLAASAMKLVASGFNWFIKHVVEAKVAGDTFNPLYNCLISDVASTTATVEIDCGADKTAKLYWGTSKTFMPNEEEGTFVSPTWTFSLTGLPSNSYIYFYVKNTGADEQGKSGIYFFKTLSA